MVGKNLKKLSGGVLLFTALVFLSFGQTLIDRVVAFVNSEPILESDVKLGMLFYNSKDRNQILSRLIDVWLISQYVQGKGLSVPEGVLDQALLNIARSNNLTLEGLQREMQSEGLTLKDLREFLKKEIIFNQGIYAILIGDVNISSVDLELEKHRRGEVKVKRVIDVLVVDKREGPKLLQILEKTKDLEEIAKLLGVSPERLSVERGALVDNLEKEVWGAKVGDLVFVEDSDHLYIAKVLEVREEYKGKSLEELREEILMRKLEERKEELIENLRKRSFIKVFG